MNKEELKAQLENLERKHQLQKQELVREYCWANNSYKIGDKFTDQMGSIVIEKIRWSYGSFFNPSCVYFGTELKKDGTPNKLGKKRNAYQSNDINK
jgi:hypothetical protein